MAIKTEVEKMLYESIIEGFSIGVNHIYNAREVMAFKRCFNTSYWESVELAQNKWAEKDSKAIDYFKDALAIIEETAKISQSVENKELLQRFDFISSQYLNILLTGQVDEYILDVYPENPLNTRYQKGGNVDWFIHADSYVIAALSRRQMPGDWPGLHKTKEKCFLHLTYVFDAYIQIIQAWIDEDWDRCIECSNEANVKVEAIPKKAHSSLRAGRYEFFDELVDYRLAAILKYCFQGREELLTKVNTRHKWLWTQEEIDKHQPGPLMDRLLSPEELGLIKTKPWWKFW